jgi:hypothetical protein
MTEMRLCVQICRVTVWHVRTIKQEKRLIVPSKTADGLFRDVQIMITFVPREAAVNTRARRSGSHHESVLGGEHHDPVQLKLLSDYSKEVPWYWDPSRWMRMAINICLCDVADDRKARAKPFWDRKLPDWDDRGVFQYHGSELDVI